MIWTKQIKTYKNKNKKYKLNYKEQMLVQVIFINKKIIINKLNKYNNKMNLYNLQNYNHKNNKLQLYNNKMIVHK